MNKKINFLLLIMVLINGNQNSLATDKQGYNGILSGLYNLKQSLWPTQPNQYSINLIWINRKHEPDQRHFLPIGMAQTFGIKPYETILKWASYHPEAEINVWFDGKLTNPSAVASTQKALVKLQNGHSQKSAPIHWRDIRSLETVRKNRAALKPIIPIFFRCDYARAAIASELIKTEPEKVMVYADLDVAPMVKDELFDRQTLKQLHQHSYVMAKEQAAAGQRDIGQNIIGFENGFQIFKYNQNLLTALNLMVLKANTIRAKDLIAEAKKRALGKSFLKNDTMWKMHLAGFQENVFYSYPLMHAYLSQLQKKGDFKTNKHNKKPYDPERDSLECMNDMAVVLLRSSNAFENLEKNRMPTKNITLPVSTSRSFEIDN